VKLHNCNFIISAFYFMNLVWSSREYLLQLQCPSSLVLWYLLLLFTTNAVECIWQWHFILEEMRRLFGKMIAVQAPSTRDYSWLHNVDRNMRADCLPILIICLHEVNSLEYRGNYIATSNDTKLVHCPLMGGLLHLVQRGGAWAGP